MQGRNPMSQTLFQNVGFFWTLSFGQIQSGHFFFLILFSFQKFVFWNKIKYNEIKKKEKEFLLAPGDHVRIYGLLRDQELNEQLGKKKEVT